MLVPECPYDLQELHLPHPPLPPGACAALVFCDALRSEPLWVQVEALVQDGTLYRARLIERPQAFTELQPGRYVFFRPEHVLEVAAGTARA